MSSLTASQVHGVILEYLQQLQRAGVNESNGVKDAEPLEIAIQCFIEATGASSSSSSSSSAAGVQAALPELLTRGAEAVKAIESSPKYPAFVSVLKEKGEFFKGVEEGTLAHFQRLEQARSKFQGKFGSAEASSAAASASSPTASPEVTSEAKAEAEQAKNEGNALLGKHDYAGAVAKYSEAIRLNPTHAIYRANRAAAYINLKDYNKAIVDCEASIEIDPLYPKSHYRLGQSHAAQGDYQACLPAFERALELSGKDEGMAVTIREQIKIAKNKLAPAPSHAGGADPFAALGGLGGMDFASLLNNPALGGLMNSPEIQQMMQNPQMMDMMKNFDIGSLMKDIAPPPGGIDAAARAAAAAGPKIEPAEVNTEYKPDASSLFDDEPAPAAAASSKPKAASKPAASSSGAGAGGAGINSQIEKFLSTPQGKAAASDPDLQPVLADIKANGVGAAMKYMSNPVVMQKIQAIMGPMMAAGKK